MMKLYFSQCAGLFSLLLEIEDQKDGSLVFHKVYPPHTVAQFSDHAIYNPDSALNDYALTISNLSYKSKNLSIKLQFSGQSAEKATAPTCFIECYGKIDEQLEIKAAEKHQAEIAKNFSTVEATEKIGQSIRHYSKKINNELTLIPAFSKNQEASAAKTEEAVPDSTEQIKTGPTTIDTASSPEMVKLLFELRDWQSQIESCIAESKPGSNADVELRALHISELQKKLATYDQSITASLFFEPQHYTAYLINHASDLTKLIKYIF